MEEYGLSNGVFGADSCRVDQKFICSCMEKVLQCTYRMLSRALIPPTVTASFFGHDTGMHNEACVK